MYKRQQGRGALHRSGDGARLAYERPGQRGQAGEGRPGDRVIYGSGVLGTELPEPGNCISSPSADGLQMNFGPVEHGPLTDAAGAELERLFNAGG